jgi:hypothetical protein
LLKKTYDLKPPRVSMTLHKDYLPKMVLRFYRT